MAEIVVFNRISNPRERPRTNSPSLYFSSTNGVVYISTKATQLLGLEAGDKVEIVCAKPAGGLRIGVRKTDSINGFEVHPKRTGMCFSSASLVSQMLTMLGSVRSRTIQLEETPSNGIYWSERSSIDRRTWAR
jgi:hypothetical protein